VGLGLANKISQAAMYKSLLSLIILFTLLQSANVSAQTATPDNFFVFVGERISLTPIAPKPGEIQFDRGWTAVYKIDTSIYGNYTNATIQFETYIHLGDSPAFSMCKNVLLYLSKYNGKWYQEKYMYNAVYRTKDGRWAGVGRSEDYGHSFNKNTSIQPEAIEFHDSVYFDLNDYSGYQLAQFDRAYYTIRDNRAYPKRGNYIEELFALKKSGVLKARGLF
jgi:hypothetical protein